MRTLVSGSEGLIGSFLVESLISKGHTVFTVDQYPTKVLSRSINHFSEGLNSENLSRFVASAKPDWVVHAAAQTSVLKSIEAPWQDASVNVLGTINLGIALSGSPVRKLVYINTAGALYSQDGSSEVTEESQIQPISPYGISKFSGEMYFEYFARLLGASFTSLALSNVYGFNAHQKFKPEGVIFKWIQSALINEKIILKGQLVSRDFIYVKDVVNAILKSLDFASLGRINVSQGESFTLEELAEKIQSVVGYDLEIQSASLEFGEIQSSSVSNTHAKTVLNWSPNYTLELGLRDMLSILKSSL
jgi:UDP-glucose 4-epimerase